MKYFKFDFEDPDSLQQINNLQKLLANTHPEKEDVALALFMITGIFFQNRPGKLAGFPGFFISGTGCHNPRSEKTNKILWGLCRYEIFMHDCEGIILTIKHERFNGGHLRAVLTKNGVEQILSADIFTGNLFWKLRTKSVFCLNPNIFMEDLKCFLRRPLQELERLSQ